MKTANVNPSPLWAVLAIAFIASLGTGVIVNGIYFLTGFHRVGQYALGATLGAIYIVAAIGASPALAMLRRVGVSSRVALGAFLIAIAALCAVPSLASDGMRSWAPWVVAASYAMLTGLMWPLIEGYVSGGRRGDSLRRATCRFNIWWAGALVVAFVGMAPLVKSDNAVMVLLLLGAVHLVALGFLPFIGPQPARTIHEAHQHPGSYPRLLRVFRIQLPMSYMVMGALSPYLPFALEALEVDEGWWTPMAAIWLLARVCTFGVMERSVGWHGRWWVAIAGGVLLLTGFAICLLAPLGSGPVMIATFCSGLALFGVGMGMVYAAALYYAMEVGHQEVAAGGTHEALIGAGYLSGPLTGLGVALLIRERAGRSGVANFEPAKLGVVSVACLAISALAILVVADEPAALTESDQRVESPGRTGRTAFDSCDGRKHADIAGESLNPLGR